MSVPWLFVIAIAGWNDFMLGKWREIVNGDFEPEDYHIGRLAAAQYFTDKKEKLILPDAATTENADLIVKWSSKSEEVDHIPWMADDPNDQPDDDEVYKIY